MDRGTRGVISGCLEMLAHLAPSLQEGEYVFCSVEDDGANCAHLHPLAMFREPEGISLILDARLAQEHRLPVISGRMRCITLEVHSSLDGVGLTASVSSALAEAGIPSNVVAAFHHDHVFVPAAMAERALDILHKLQAEARAKLP